MSRAGRTPRLKALGNAVSPQVSYIVGKVVLELEWRRTAHLMGGQIV